MNTKDKNDYWFHSLWETAFDLNVEGPIGTVDTLIESAKATALKLSRSPERTAIERLISSAKKLRKKGWISNGF